jgi:hypothetical protein
MLLIAMFAVCCQIGLKASPFDQDVSALIHKRCAASGSCRIRIADATEFDWDEMYVFRSGLLGVEAENILPGAKAFSGEFNRKIAFVKAGKIVRLDETAEIVEGEHTPDGTVFFYLDADGNADCLRYMRDAEFDVTSISLTRGVGYYLACANCQQSPVFAEFGKATESE